MKIIKIALERMKKEKCDCGDRNCLQAYGMEQAIKILQEEINNSEDS